MKLKGNDVLVTVETARGSRTLLIADGIPAWESNHASRVGRAVVQLVREIEMGSSTPQQGSVK